MKKILLFSAALIALLGCVEDKMFEGPSSIDKVAFTPEAPTSIAPVNVTATVSGLQAVTSATLNYNGNNVQMTGSGTQFTATIPAMADGTDVSFTVSVTNEAGFTTTSDKFTYKVGDPAPDWSKLKLNEVYGANKGSDDEKFIELYNGSDFPIKLTGVTINKDEELTWTGLDGHIVPAKGCFVIMGAKTKKEDTDLTKGFKSGFSAKKSVILELFDNKGNKIDVFQRGDKDDSGKWGASITAFDGSWSRIPDGTGKWMRTDKTTPGAINSTDAVADDYVKNE